MSLERQDQKLQQSDPSDAYEEGIDDDNYDELTTVDQYVNSSYVQDVQRDESAASPSRCAVCQDAASGMHYGVPACNACKNFFRRIFSSSTTIHISSACAHSVPLEMTPQSRTSCQWCRLKKCCAVNMSPQRSKRGRHAKFRTRGAAAAATAGDLQILLLGSQKDDSLAASIGAAYCRASDVSDQHLLAYIEQKRREFESQISRRSGFRKAQPQPQPPPQLPPPPPPPPPLCWQQPQHQQQQQQSVNCLRLISRGHTAWQSSMPDCSSSVATGPAAAVAKDSAFHHLGSNQILISGAASLPDIGAGLFSSPPSSVTVASSAASSPGSAARAPIKVWLEKPCLLSTPLSIICRRLAGPQRATELEDLHNSLSFNNVMSHLILTAVDKFVSYYEADLNSEFAGNAACGQVIAENSRLILEGHRKTFYFTQERMRQLRRERLPQLYEPTKVDEGAVLCTLVEYIPQLMLRIVAFTRNIFGSTSSPSMPTPAPQQQQQHFENHCDRFSVSSCSDAITDADKKRLIMQHCFKLVGMRFCPSLVQSQQDYIIDPTMRFMLTRRFLQSARHPMLSQLFIKFFDVSRKWDSLRINENELAFLSAFCLTSPYIGIQYPEDMFEDLSSVISVNSAVIGLFWIYLRSEEIAMRGCTVEMVASDPWLNLAVRLAAVKRLLELSTVFTNLLSIDGMHNAAMIESVIEKLNTTPLPASEVAAAAAQASGSSPSMAGELTEGFPNFTAPYNTVDEGGANASALQHCGAGVY